MALARRKLAHHARGRSLRGLGTGLVRWIAPRSAPPRHATHDAEASAPRHAVQTAETEQVLATPLPSAGLFARSSAAALAFTHVHVLKRAKRRAPLIAASVFFLSMLSFGFLIGLAPSSSSGDPHSTGTTHNHRAQADSATETNSQGNALKMLGAGANIKLAPATAPPVAAPAALVNQPPLAARENFAFAPYWTLGQSSTFSITGLSTLAYFSIDVNPNGTLDESGPGWSGFQSQALANLITRAHTAG